MSITFITDATILFEDLFDGRLEQFGIHEKIGTDTSAEHRCLTDGRNYLWLNAHDRALSCLTSYYSNGSPQKILAAISHAFDTPIFSQYDPQFHGFATQEEWDRAEEDRAKKYRDQFYTDVANYVRERPNGIKPGTIGHIQAEIAKKLVANDRSLLSPEKKDDLMGKMRQTYEADHLVTVTLDEGNSFCYPARHPRR